MIKAEIDRLRLLDRIRLEHAFLRRTLAGLTPAELDAPGTLGEWSAKGLLAHLTYHEAAYLAAVARADPPPFVPYGQPDASIDAINAAAFLAARDRPLGDVLADFEDSYTRVLEHVGACSAADLFTPGLYPWMGELTWLDMLAANTCDHYHEHAVQVGEWRGASDPTTDRLRLLDLIRTERDFLLRALAGLTADALDTPGALGEWSLKGVIAHLTFWVRNYLVAMDTAARGLRPDPLPCAVSDAEVEVLNARAYAAALPRSPAEIVADFVAVNDALLAHVFTLPEDALFAPGTYPWMDDLTPAQLVTFNSFAHYHEHATLIRQWRMSRQFTVNS